MSAPSLPAAPAPDGRRPTLFCFGYGYSAAELGRRLGRSEAGADWRILGTTRTAEKRDRLALAGVEALLDDDPSAVAAALATATHVLVSAGPDEDGDPTLRRHGAALATARLAWLGYLSTTGVYGDHDGAWIDETTPLAPSTERGRARVAAEAAWAEQARAARHPLHVFRLAGIYGPGRGPFAKLRSGAARRLVKPGQVFSRIHVEDIAAALAASMARPTATLEAPAVYNVCDDRPAPPQDVIAYAARLLGLPPPPEEPFETAAATLSPMALSFYAESKRVSNAKLRGELGVDLAYPDYESGLRAVLAAERA